jgi:hypothetical protein
MRSLGRLLPAHGIIALPTRDAHHRSNAVVAGITGDIKTGSTGIGNDIKKGPGKAGSKIKKNQGCM